MEPVMVRVPLDHVLRLIAEAQFLQARFGGTHHSVFLFLGCPRGRTEYEEKQARYLWAECLEPIYGHAVTCGNAVQELADDLKPQFPWEEVIGRGWELMEEANQKLVKPS